MQDSERLRKPTFSFEVLAVNAEETVRALMPFKPAWISIVSRGHADLELCRDIQDKFGVEVVAHLLCFDFDRAQTEKALRILWNYGVRSVFALQGEGAPMAPRGPGFNHCAADLVKQIRELGLDFRVGVAGYPEGHFAAVSLDADILYLKAKVEAGADYVITQMFFENEKFYAFERRGRNTGIVVPIIPGIKILNSKAQVDSIQHNFHVEVPKKLMYATQNSSVETAGAKWIQEQINDLIMRDIHVHLFVMGDSLTLIKSIELFKSPFPSN